jgi:hypothetical protein
MQGTRILRNEAYFWYAAMTKDEVQHSRMTFYEAIPEADIQVNNRLPGVFSLFLTTGTAYSLFSLTVI